MRKEAPANMNELESLNKSDKPPVDLLAGDPKDLSDDLLLDTYIWGQWSIKAMRGLRDEAKGFPKIEADKQATVDKIFTELEKFRAEIEKRGLKTPTEEQGL